MKSAVKGEKRIAQGTAVIVFTRVPRPGRVKTRMMPYLDGEGCAELLTCFLTDIRDSLIRTGADIIVCYDDGGDGKAEPLRSIFGSKVRYIPQRGSGLGQKMEAAFDDAFGLGYTSCLLMGSDIPEMRTEEILEAAAGLERSDIVIGPSADGGYWLIGMHSPHYCLFEDREYSHGNVLEELIGAADSNGLAYEFAAEHQDMDTPQDLSGYRDRLRRDPALRKSRTGRFLRDKMSISLILPVYNEITTIGRMISQLEPLRNDFEIIIADGGSTDGTCDRIPDEFRVIRTDKGRAVQMNAGASAAQGDILFFLHCDSELPEDPAGEIRRIMAEYEAGCFGIAFHSGHFFMLTNRVISNMRAKYHRIMFGDQGIFMTRELFERIGGFPEIPIMEDYQLSLTLREMGVRTGMARRRIYTSDRRYPKQTIPMLRLMHTMYRLRREYKAGVPADEIAAQYRDVR